MANFQEPGSAALRVDALQSRGERRSVWNASLHGIREVAWKYNLVQRFSPLLEVQKDN
jgi:hypothetical protein